MTRKIKSLADLNAVREKAQGEIDLRGAAKEMRITVHMGTCGIATGARDILSTFMNELDQAGVENLTLHQSGCAGLCDREPMITLVDKEGEEFHYGNLDRNKVHRIVQEHVLKGTPVMEYLLKR